MDEASSKTLDLFHRVANEIHAYKEFLEMQNFDPSSVKSPADYKSVPIISKDNYLKKWDYKNLMWEHSFNGPLWYCATSGSTGSPYYFPRTEDLAHRGSHYAEEFLNYSSYGNHARSLVIMAFGLGVWIGGFITLRSFEMAIVKNGLSVSLLPTGYNKEQIFKALKELSPNFDQTILIGYPPFVKEVIDECGNNGINLKNLNMRLMFAAEAFSETFRNYVCEAASVNNKYLDTLNIYGSADLGAMAYETPLSILVRELALEDPMLYRDIFGNLEKTPTLAQYHPEYIYFEEVDGKLLISSDSAMPLIRYSIGDHGGVISYEHIDEIFKKYGISLAVEISNKNLSKIVDKRPFVYVYERSDLSASLHGIIIYPEFIKTALFDSSISNYVTGKFTMYTKNDIEHNQFLQVNIELRKNIKASNALSEKVGMCIRETLIDKSSEFSELSRSRNTKSIIRLVLWANSHPRYFAPNTKQQWTKK